ncbi:hypothetical protein GGI12_004084 [Dipsacomyces acuminosporus]|nr:hypothetical protein GGI12_004084 [Dipsacomyces acuminosporus]
MPTIVEEGADSGAACNELQTRAADTLPQPNTMPASSPGTSSIGSSLVRGFRYLNPLFYLRIILGFIRSIFGPCMASNSRRKAKDGAYMSSSEEKRSSKHLHRISAVELLKGSKDTVSPNSDQAAPSTPEFEYLPDVQLSSLDLNVLVDGSESGPSTEASSSPEPDAGAALSKAAKDAVNDSLLSAGEGLAGRAESTKSLISVATAVDGIANDELPTLPRAQRSKDGAEGGRQGWHRRGRG